MSILVVELASAAAVVAVVDFAVVVIVAVVVVEIRIVCVVFEVVVAFVEPDSICPIQSLMLPMSLSLHPATNVPPEFLVQDPESQFYLP